MRRYLSSFLSIAAFSVVLAGCDSFAVLNQFYKGLPLSLTLQKESVQQSETINLYPVGGVPPYSFGLVQGNLYHPGTLGSISSQTYTAGNEIGTVTIYLSDTSGASANAVVTIIPPTPSSFSVQPYPGGTANDILVSWNYSNTSEISGFLIQRSLDGVTFIDLPIVPSSSTSYIDQPLNPGQTYYYRMYAVAGPYQSLPTSVMGSTP